MDLVGCYRGLTGVTGVLAGLADSITGTTVRPVVVPCGCSDMIEIVSLKVYRLNDDWSESWLLIVK